MAEPPHLLERPVRPRAADDAMRLLAALAQLAGQDPALGFRRSAESDWIILEGDGEAQLETAR
jgi:translation elongation factor EF-G